MLIAVSMATTTESVHQTRPTIYKHTRTSRFDVISSWNISNFSTVPYFNKV